MQVKVKRRGDDQKFLARVLAIGTECDIALLTVDDPAFWQGVEPLEFGPLPRLQVNVSKTIAVVLDDAGTIARVSHQHCRPQLTLHVTWGRMQ